MKKAISVLSGGLDCTVATSIYSKDYEIYAITFNYGQKSFKRELKASREICNKMNWKHEVIDLPWLAQISNSTLTTSEEVPEPSSDDLDDFDKSSESASSVWVPARNTVFTSIALAYAESIGAEIIIVGWNFEEGTTFPDNSKEYLDKFNELFDVGSPWLTRFSGILYKADLNVSNSSIQYPGGQGSVLPFSGTTSVFSECQVERLWVQGIGKFLQNA